MEVEAVIFTSNSWLADSRGIGDWDYTQLL
jgi:hypothetical protein